MESRAKGVGPEEIKTFFCVKNVWTKTLSEVAGARSVRLRPGCSSPPVPPSHTKSCTRYCPFDHTKPGLWIRIRMIPHSFSLENNRKIKEKMQGHWQ